jgi:hypothetical protein
VPTDIGPSSSKSTGTMAGLSDIVAGIDDLGSSLTSAYCSQVPLPPIPPAALAILLSPSPVINDCLLIHRTWRISVTTIRVAIHLFIHPSSAEHSCRDDPIPGLTSLFRLAGADGYIDMSALALQEQDSAPREFVFLSDQLSAAASAFGNPSSKAEV